MFSVLSLLRGTRLSARLFRWAAVMILLCRGLLSGAVMFDMHAPVGSFGLVICSGFGPMFPSIDARNAAQNDDAMADQVDMRAHDTGMTMSGMTMDSAMADTMSDASLPRDTSAPDTMSGGMPMHATADANDICAFSAALLLGVSALVVVVLLLGTLPIVRRLRTRCARVLHYPLRPFALPLSRAPPAAVPFA
jgi:hypothetical protein